MNTKKNRVHSFSDDILGHLDAMGLKQLLDSGEVSQKEVIETTIQRANQIKGTLNPIAQESFEKAIQRSNEKAVGYFAGIPTIIKDLTNVEGLTTRFGSEAFAQVAPSKTTDPIAEQMFDMGFINLGLSTMPEFGLTCSTEFPDLNNTLNPWQPEYSAGGSSGGSAVLVATGVVPIAHAADGGGSTRIPAACCGLVGLKPSRGRILKSEAFAKQLVEISIDGIITRSVRDTAHFYHQAEQSYHNKGLPKIGLVSDPLRKKLNIGFIEEVALSKEVDTSTKNAFADSIKLLEDLGHTLKPVKFPVTEQIKKDFRLYWCLSGFIVNKLGKRLFPTGYDPTKLTPFIKGLSKEFGKNFWKLGGVVKRLNRTPESYQKFLDDEDIDILLTPTIGHLTPKIGHLDMNLDFETMIARLGPMAPYTAYFNINGAPSISLPLSHDEEKDLPIGMLFSAAYGQERLLLELSYQIEEANPWKRIHD